MSNQEQSQNQGQNQGQNTNQTTNELPPNVTIEAVPITQEEEEEEEEEEGGLPTPGVVRETEEKRRGDAIRTVLMSILSTLEDWLSKKSTSELEKIAKMDPDDIMINYIYDLAKTWKDRMYRIQSSMRMIGQLVGTEQRRLSPRDLESMLWERVLASMGTAVETQIEAQAEKQRRKSIAEEIFRKYIQEKGGSKNE